MVEVRVKGGIGRSVWHGSRSRGSMGVISDLGEISFIWDSEARFVRIGL